MKEIKSLKKKGMYDPDSQEPFDLFIESSEIRYCYYKETHKILGNTFLMLILQDFESITPNILCRTIETVEGGISLNKAFLEHWIGGLVIFLLGTMNSLKQLHSLTMDVHQRFRTDAFQVILFLNFPYFLGR